MQKVAIFIFLAATIMLSSGCSSLRFPGVYKVRVQQGNFIEKKMVDQLKVGMTKRQVQYIMGTALLQDTFAPDRWDYLFMVQRGGEVLIDKRFTVYFANATLDRWETDIEFKSTDVMDSNAETEAKEDDVPDPNTDRL